MSPGCRCCEPRQRTLDPNRGSVTPDGAEQGESPSWKLEAQQEVGKGDLQLPRLSLENTVPAPRSRAPRLRLSG